MENLNKLIIVLLLPVISFSQCENTILDETLSNQNVNTYFQLAMSLNIEDLSYLDECTSPNMIGDEYILFAPGNDIPASAITDSLQSINGQMIDYINYYAWENLYDVYGFASDNNVMILDEICTCNGTIYIIDGLLWNPLIGINEYNLNKSLIKTIDITGKEVANKGLHINIYSDGSTEKIYLK